MSLVSAPPDERGDQPAGPLAIVPGPSRTGPKKRATGFLPVALSSSRGFWVTLGVPSPDWATGRRRRVHLRGAYLSRHGRRRRYRTRAERRRGREPLRVQRD